jgi:hypothetical protein
MRVTVDEFIEEWRLSGGNERANSQTFINDLCELIGVQRPRGTQSDMAANDYVFERHMVKTEIDGATSNAGLIATSESPSYSKQNRVATATARRSIPG